MINRPKFKLEHLHNFTELVYIDILKVSVMKKIFHFFIN